VENWRRRDEIRWLQAEGLIEACSTHRRATHTRTSTDLDVLRPLLLRPDAALRWMAILSAARKSSPI
jgi:hypothetical protein